MTPGDSTAPTPPGGDVLSAAVLDRLDAMSKTLEKVAKRIEAVAGRERQTRRLAWMLAASFALDIILTVVVTVLSVNALSQANAIHQSQLAACTVSNTTRAQQIELWEFLFKLAGPKTASNPQDQALLKFVKKTFAPVNCAQVYHR